jgi:hypothetical protein
LMGGISIQPLQPSIRLPPCLHKTSPCMQGGYNPLVFGNLHDSLQ